MNEIFETTGVLVEVPPSDSDSDTITLRGEPDQLGLALSLVYAKVLIALCFADTSTLCYLYFSSSISVFLCLPIAVESSRLTVCRICLAVCQYVKLPIDGLICLLYRLVCCYHQAHSMLADVIDAPAWLHRYIIGPKGVDIKKIILDFSQVLISPPLTYVGYHSLSID